MPTLFAGSPKQCPIVPLDPVMGRRVVDEGTTPYKERSIAPTRTRIDQEDGRTTEGATEGERWVEKEEGSSGPPVMDDVHGAERNVEKGVSDLSPTFNQPSLRPRPRSTFLLPALLLSEEVPQVAFGTHLSTFYLVVDHKSSGDQSGSEAREYVYTDGYLWLREIGSCVLDYSMNSRMLFLTFVVRVLKKIFQLVFTELLVI